MSVHVHKSPWFVHWDTRVPRLTALQEGAEKEGSWRSSQSNAFTLHQIPAVGLNPLCARHVSIQGFPWEGGGPESGCGSRGGGKGEQKQRECIHRRPHISIVLCPPVVPGTWQMIVDNDGILWFLKLVLFVLRWRGRRLGVGSLGEWKLFSCLWFGDYSKCWFIRDYYSWCQLVVVMGWGQNIE